MFIKIFEFPNIVSIRSYKPKKTKQTNQVLAHRRKRKEKIRKASTILYACVI